MGNHRRMKQALGSAVLAMAMAMFGIVGSASAHEGEWAKFNQCPSTSQGVWKCLYSLTTGGHVQLGNKNVPIVNPVTLQGGMSEPTEFVSTFIGASNGQTLSKTPQPVPGGLAGLVNCKEISDYILRTSCEWTFENALTGVNATLELARPASEIRVNQIALVTRNGAALKLPVKVHLENPFLGSACYVGSSSSPIIWNLTTGTSTPPAPFEPITGKPGTPHLTEESQIFSLQGTELVDNTWSAPHASGCGGFLVELLLDPIIDGMIGLPSSAGENAAVLAGENSIALASQVNLH